MSKRVAIVSNNSSNLINDLNSFWMPFTANRQFKSNPRMLVKAKDMHYQTIDDRAILGMPNFSKLAAISCAEVAALISRSTKSIRPSLLT